MLTPLLRQLPAALQAHTTVHRCRQSNTAVKAAAAYSRGHTQSTSLAGPSGMGFSRQSCAASTSTSSGAHPGSQVGPLQAVSGALPAVDDGSGNDGGNGAFNGGGGGDWAHDGEGNEEELLDLSQAEHIAAAKGVSLPLEFAAAAVSGGLRASALHSYLALQNLPFAAWLARLFPFVRNRLIADPRYLFIIFAEVAIDSGCATVAEVRKRGKDFWGEFEFYLSDLVVGCVLDVVLVTLMAPVAIIGAQSKAATSMGLARLLANVPSSMFEMNKPGQRYSAGARAACLGVKALEYSLAGLVCGFIGQGIANSLMTLKRKYHSSEDDVEIPPLGMTALTWGLFMGASSNIRYQIVVGLERLVDLTIAKKSRKISYFTTTGLRFANNIIGGENFIDMARWTGIQ